MRVGHTYTNDFDLETRQHEILGFDLGEGPTRRAVVVGLLLLTVWAGGLLLMFGTPNRYAFSAYFLPPLIITIYGTQRSDRNPRRWKLTHWALMIRFVLIGHRPIINAGRRAATRSEWLPLRERLGHRAETISTVPGLGALRAPDSHPRTDATAGPAIRLTTRVRLYGPDRLVKAHIKEGRR